MHADPVFESEGEPASPSSDCERPRSPLAVGVPAFLALALCLSGIGRAFSFDESVTVGSFVVSPSLWDAATRQVVSNNHQAISVLDHLIWLATGSTSEPLLRILPTGVFVTATALLSSSVARRFGWRIGLVAGVLFCTNPLMFSLARDIRGYGLLVLCSIGATLLLTNLRRRRDEQRAVVIGYVLVAVIGMSAHVYMLAILAAHVAAAIFDPDLRRRRAFQLPVLGALLGLVVQAPLLVESLQNGRGRTFDIGFPLDLSWALLGGGVLAVIATTVFLAGPARTAWRNPSLRAAGLTLIALAAVLWIVAPTDLYPRFFVSVLPVLALGAALGWSKLTLRSGGPRALAWLLLALIIGSNLQAIVPAINRSDLANRDAAALVEAAVATGASACVLATSWQPLLAYEDLPIVRTGPELDDCDLVVSLVPELDEPALRVLPQTFPNLTVLDDASATGRIFSRGPQACVLDPRSTCWVQDDGPP